MNVDDFIRHHGVDCPVKPSARVVYRTVATDRESGVSVVSHVHAPVMAGEIDWSLKPTIGRVFDYKVVG